ncbi:DeoR family transcriptional regulator [Paenibacillus sp. S28]|uniref:DeoR family transcriptional regulator n=1 Tax=Paenibacillus sp. S28 TaxID=2767463 RepID=UPI00190DABAA|nr:DeoR family transcriptional regulator [Paenibacillus sp. S28]MBJ9989151.1 DeoR/GlpR transcriptional regulator [Paenibacillus sp. S28]
MSGPPRRDLEKLEESRSVRRTYGGAIFEGKGITIQKRSGILTVKKLRIGSKAAAIQLGKSIFIDGGTTFELSYNSAQEHGTGQCNILTLDHITRRA